MWKLLHTNTSLAGEEVPDPQTTGETSQRIPIASDPALTQVSRNIAGITDGILCLGEGLV